jgi:branched-chain amino acid transport system substrate-binding protein
VSSNPNVSANQASGLIPVLALLNIMQGYKGSSVTPAVIKAQLKLPAPYAVPLSGGITFVCNGTAIPLLPSVCSAQTAIGTVSSTGAIGGLQTYNPTPLFKA